MRQWSSTCRVIQIPLKVNLTEHLTDFLVDSPSEDGMGIHLSLIVGIFISYQKTFLILLFSFKQLLF